MIRSDHILAGAFSLLILVVSCLSMVADRCPGCAAQWLSSLAMGALGTAAVAGVAVLMAAVWRISNLWRVCHTQRVPHPSRLRHACQRSGLTAAQVICTAQVEPLAFCIGLLYPRVVVSAGLVAQVSTSELTAILAHERQHQRRRDPVRVLLVTLLRFMLYPLPLIHDLSRWFLTSIEIEADEAAIACSGRPALASALYTLLALSVRPEDALRPTVVAPFSVQSSRLAYLLDPDQTLPWPVSLPRLVVSLAPFLLLCLLMASG